MAEPILPWPPLCVGSQGSQEVTVPWLGTPNLPRLGLKQKWQQSVGHKIPLSPTSQGSDRGLATSHAWPAPCPAAGSCHGPICQPFQVPTAHRHREGGSMPTASTEGNAKGDSPRASHCFWNPHGAWIRVGHEENQAVVGGTGWPSSGSKSNFPSRSFWCSLGFFKSRQSCALW